MNSCFGKSVPAFTVELKRRRICLGLHLVAGIVVGVVGVLEVKLFFCTLDGLRVADIRFSLA